MPNISSSLRRRPARELVANLPLVPVRQTVLAGRVDASGYANFLEAGDGLTVNLKASEDDPVILAFADGFDRNGAVDHVKAIEEDVIGAWSLSPSAMSYLYVDLDAYGNVSFGVSAIAPLYQPTAPGSPAAGQAWFDTTTMILKVREGSLWVPKRRVYVGEAVTGPSSVTSLVTYALRGEYDSGWFAVSSGNVYIKTHNLGIADSKLKAIKQRPTGGSIIDDVPTLYWYNNLFYGYRIGNLNNRLSVRVRSSDRPFVPENGASGTSCEWRFQLSRGW